MKKLLFLGIGIVLLVVVAAVGMSLVGGGGKEADVAARPEEPQVPREPVTIELRPLSAPLVQDGEVVRYVILTARYDLLATKEEAAKAEQDKPILRDAIVRAVHAKPVTVTTDGKAFAAGDLQARFFDSANGVFAKGATQAVDVGEAQVSKAPPAAPPPGPKKESGDQGGGH